jgi:hypothetical protein
MKIIVTAELRDAAQGLRDSGWRQHIDGDAPLEVGQSGVLRDSNGNTVGSWEVTADEDTEGSGHDEDYLPEFEAWR